MKRTGREMRALMLAVSASALLLLLAIIAHFMLDAAITSNRNIERNKKLLVEQSEMILAKVAGNISGMHKNPAMRRLFNEDLIVEVLSGNLEAFNALVGDFVIAFFPVDYVGVIRDGEVAYHRTAPGIEVDLGEMPASPPEGDYQTLESFAGREGFYVSAFYHIDLSNLRLGDFHINMVLDRGHEMREVERLFREQRNRQLVRMGLASAIAVVLSLLLTTLGLRHFTRKYVVRPIEGLNRIAEEIVEGTYEGEVQVKEDSAYAALQGLLRSGQKVLSRIDREMRK